MAFYSTWVRSNNIVLSSVYIKIYLTHIIISVPCLHSIDYISIVLLFFADCMTKNLRYSNWKNSHFINILFQICYNIQQLVLLRVSADYETVEGTLVKKILIYRLIEKLLLLPKAVASLIIRPRRKPRRKGCEFYFHVCFLSKNN